MSGIWPPDVGGPASHAPEVAGWLRDRGHSVEAVVTADRAPAAESYPVHWVSRSLPAGIRHAAALRLISARARRADVVYSTGMFGRSSLGAFVARTPLVLKLTADPAFERARRRGLVAGEVGDFQAGGGGRLRRSCGWRGTPPSRAPPTSSARAGSFAISSSLGACRANA